MIFTINGSLLFHYVHNNYLGSKKLKIFESLDNSYNIICATFVNEAERVFLVTSNKLRTYIFDEHKN